MNTTATVLIALIIGVYGLVYGLLNDVRVRRLEKELQTIKERREKLYASLANEDKIMADMERGAVAMEALQAKRNRNIRDDSGPHARIYRPRLRSRLPGTIAADREKHELEKLGVEKVDKDHETG
jgi:hypothetical protein